MINSEVNTQLLTRKCIFVKNDSPFSRNFFVETSCSAFLNSPRQAQNLYKNSIEYFQKLKKKSFPRSAKRTFGTYYHYCM